jgi:hypothetical protein
MPVLSRAKGRNRTPGPARRASTDSRPLRLARDRAQARPAVQVPARRSVVVAPPQPRFRQAQDVRTRAAEGVQGGTAGWSFPRNGQGPYGGRSDPLTRRLRLGQAGGGKGQHVERQRLRAAARARGRELSQAAGTEESGGGRKLSTLPRCNFPRARRGEGPMASANIGTIRCSRSRGSTTSSGAKFDGFTRLAGRVIRRWSHPAPSEPS